MNDPHTAPPSITSQTAVDAGRPERRRRRIVGSGEQNPRVAAAQYVGRHRMEPFVRALEALAVAVFGGEATVVPHLRTVNRKQRLTLVIDAADGQAGLDYSAFLPREQAFWTAYAHLAKPDVPFLVAIRPARGWCRSEALAPFFVHLPVGGGAT